jgi:hypothetical protein
MNAAGPQQLRDELVSTIRRYAQESDVSVCEALGVLRIVEIEVINWIQQANNETQTETQD